ncbi:hypothetical protein [Nostoc sp. TCL240-02]|nr:hypothetical protein [Nostoc sp. TCL240-02]
MACLATVHKLAQRGKPNVTPHPKNFLVAPIAGNINNIYTWV